MLRYNPCTLSQLEDSWEQKTYGLGNCFSIMGCTYLFYWILLAVTQQGRCRQAPSAGFALPTAQRKLLQNDPVAAAAPDLTRLSKRLIVVLREDAPDAATAAAALISEGQKALATLHKPRDAATTAIADAAGDQITVLRLLGSTSAGTAAVAWDAPSSVSSSRAPRAIVLTAPAAAIAIIKRSKLVKAVIPDSVIAHQAAPGCTQPGDLSAGLTAAPSASFKWPGCLVPGAQLIWKGRACSGTKVQYTHIFAVDRKGGVLRNAGKQCVLEADPTKATWNRQRFGACGTAPLYARTLPVSICASKSSPGGDDPMNPNTQTPIPTVMPRVPLTSGEEAPAGIVRIEAASKAGGAFNTAGLPIAQQVVVGVVDSGIDGTHPDLNVVGGKAWMTTSPEHADDSVDPLTDHFGHGTHTAGIIGAKNSGSGVVGVAPGVPLYSLKVLDGSGVGSLSDAMAAVEWAASAEGQAQGIRVINLSLAAYVDPKSAQYGVTYDLVCRSLKSASDAGVTVVAAMGNYAASIEGYLPASCPTVVAVSSMDPASNQASTFTNFVPANMAELDKTRIFAAPGNAIKSTVSFNREKSGYRTLSGTSMACPHVAGVFATCIMAGSCAYSATGISRAATLQAAASERLRIATAAAYGFTGDLASGSSNGRIVGNLVWAKF